MENYFYHIRCDPMSVTIFITHVCILRNGSYGNECTNINKATTENQSNSRVLYFPSNIVRSSYIDKMHFSHCWLRLCQVQSKFSPFIVVNTWRRGWTGGYPIPTSLPLSPRFPPPLPPLPTPSNPTSLPLSDFSLPLIKFCSCS